jgi:general secretion pathway protein C
MNDLVKPVDRWASIPWRGCLIVLGVSFLLASLLSTFLAQVFLPKGRAAAASTNAMATGVNVPGATLNGAGVDVILKRNIFNSEGAAVDETKKTEEDPANKTPSVEIVKSDLQVKLLGTIYGGDPYSGLALVENSSKKTINSFMVGDLLLAKATIKEVHREKIIIDRDGRLEYIEVAKTELARNKRKKKTSPTGVQQTIAPIATEPPPDKFKEEGFERDGKGMVMTKAYQQKLLTTDFTKVLQDAKATPNVEGGELKGFCLTRIRKDSIYEKAGLQNDDCVTEINGVPLQDAAQAIRLLQSLRNESDIDVRLTRGGAPMTFNLQIH